MPREYNHLSIWTLAVGDYVLRSVKESSFRSPLYQFMHRLMASTIHHREEHDKVPSGTFFSIWHLLHVDVDLHIRYTIASFLSSSLALGSQPQSKIYGGHFIFHLAWSYGLIIMGLLIIPFYSWTGRI